MTIDSEEITDKMWEKINHFVYQNALHYLHNNHDQTQYAELVEQGCIELLEVNDAD